MTRSRAIGIVRSGTVDMDIVRRDIRLNRQSFDGSDPLDLPVRVWIDQAEALANEVDRLQAQAPALAAENQKLREALGAAVREIRHHTRKIGPGSNGHVFCGGCGMSWPCPTVPVRKALATAAPLLEGEGASK